MERLKAGWVSRLLSLVGIASGSPPAVQAASDDAPRAANLHEGFPYEIVSIKGSEALETWTRLCGAGRGWPVVVGGDDDLRTIAEAFKFNTESTSQTIAEVIKAAETIKVPEDIKAWHLYMTDGDGDLDEPVGEWPANVPKSDLALTVARNIHTGKPLERVHVVLLPTENGWEGPAYLRWGGWNACPPAEYHVAILRSWHERFGAKLAGLRGDVINLNIALPLHQRDIAMAVAHEQYEYCPDIVEQGTNDISSLAASLINARWWYFWWD